MFLDISKDTWKTYWYPTILIISILGGVIAIVLGFIGENHESEKAESEYKNKQDRYSSELERYNKLLLEINSEIFQKKERVKRFKILLEESKNHIFRSL